MLMGGMIVGQAAMPYCDGSTVRCEAVLKVAFDAWI